MTGAKKEYQFRYVNAAPTSVGGRKRVNEGENWFGSIGSFWESGYRFNPFVKNKGDSGEIDAGVPYQQTCGCIRRQPVGRVNAAAPGYHYTLDHLLSLEPPRPRSATSRIACGL